MTEDDLPIPPANGERTVLGCRVSEEVQERFGTWVTETFENRKGAFGYCVEQAMKEFMDGTRNARIDDELDDIRETTQETNALVRRIITAEKEKGAFLEPAPKGNQAGDRRERENAVITELARRVAMEGRSPEYKESELNAVIVDKAGVASEPSKRDYRESLMDRGMLEPAYGKYKLTDQALRVGGFQVVES